MAACGCAAGPLLWLAQHAPLDQNVDADPCACAPAVVEQGPACAVNAEALRERAPQQDAALRFAEEAGYEICDVLGIGTFGRVVKANSQRHGCQCALKIIEEKLADEREATCQAGFDHPHIARFLESFWQGGRLYVAAEMCYGGELYDALSRTGRCSEVVGKALFRQIMQAVEYMHLRAVAHRDLKLDNFLLEQRGVPLAESTLKLIDFGFATRFVPGRRTMKTKCGTEGFVAPEVLTSQLYGEGCDVFSAGVLLHCLLTGKMPFKDIAQAARGDIHFGGKEGKKSLSAGARRIIEWMLRPRPDQRPTAMDVMGTTWLQAALVLEERPASPMSSSTSSCSSASPRYELISSAIRSFGKAGASVLRSRLAGVARTSTAVTRGCRMAAVTPRDRLPLAPTARA